MTYDVSDKFPTVPKDLSSIVKPEELVDIIEMTPLTLQDRRIYNLLLGNAWNQIATNKQHTIARSDLTQYVDSNNQNIAQSLRRLMSAIVIIKVRHNRNGKPSTRQMQLLADNEIEERGHISYRFPDALIKVIRDTQIFARLHTKVMFELSSKYSLALYEFLQKRKNLRYVTEEIIPIEEVRGLLGVGDNKLKSFGHLNDKAIKPACKEVSFLTEYDISAEPIRTGRAVTHIKFSWKKKQDIGAQISAVEEIERSKVGRNARMNQKVEALDSITSSQKSDFITPEAIRTGRQLVAESGARVSFEKLHEEFTLSLISGFKPENTSGAFVGFVRKKIGAVV